MAYLYLAASVESILPSDNGSDPSSIAKTIHTAKQFSFQEWEIFNSQLPLYGMMSDHYRANAFTNGSMSYMQDSPARTSVLQDLEKAWRESEVAYSMRSLGCAARLSLDSSFWKTFLPLLPEVEQKWLGNLPCWGMTVDGALYPLRPLERYTVAKGGFSWPTPQARAQTDTSSERNRHTPCLETAVKMYPTPCARDWKGETNENRNSPTLPDAVGSGKLNPDWVNWLMGYPSGWINLEPWAIVWFRNKSKKRSKS